MTQEFDTLPEAWKAALARGETVSLRRAGKITARIVPENAPEHRLDDETVQKRLAAWQQFQKKHRRVVNHHIETSRESIYAEGEESA